MRHLSQFQDGLQIRTSPQDDLIMGTNQNSIVSKRSVERLYYPEPHFFRYFVKKPHRRSPLINRGYWLRMQLIERSVLDFLRRPSNYEKKIVVNLGCGYDPLAFQLLGNQTDLCQNVIFIDVDHTKLILEKINIITHTPQLRSLLWESRIPGNHEYILLSSNNYRAIGCDIRDTDRLEMAIKSEISIDKCEMIFIAEVSLTYLDVTAADQVINWASYVTDSVQFYLLEQYLPAGQSHPFAKTMLNHFSKLQVPIRSIHQYPSLELIERRFVNAGWRQAKARSLWDCWQDPSEDLLTSTERRNLDFVESFDEWEEFALVASHYFLLHASSLPYHPSPKQPYNWSPPESEGDFRLVHHKHSKSKSRRKYGAIVPFSSNTIGHHGGLGQQERLQSTDIFGSATQSLPPQITPPPSLPVRMCHTITHLDADDCLIVGGRSSPDHVMANCWLRSSKGWAEVCQLPIPRFRHCAVKIRLPGGPAGVIVFGGKTNATSLLGDWLIWQPEIGWLTLKTNGQSPYPLFAATMASLTDDSGILFGGIDENYQIQSAAWYWKLIVNSDQPVLEIKCLSEIMNTQINGCFARFGASACTLQGTMVVAGGILKSGVSLPHQDVLELCLNDETIGENPIKDVAPKIPTPSRSRPLLVGHSMAKVGNDRVLILGGGALCFSFGTHWNEDTWELRRQNDVKNFSWDLLDTSSPNRFDQMPDSRSNEAIHSLTQISQVPRVKIARSVEFNELVRRAKPVVLEGLDIGRCTKLWTMDYLRRKVGSDRIITVHESKSRNMNFQSKNFDYVRKTFGEFLDQVENGAKEYLRSIAIDKPTETAANLNKDFPDIAGDFRLPPELETVTQNAHSSPLRISGPVSMWLHYDVMANVLCQIRGVKRLILYPPSDVSKLGFSPGASSSTVSVFESGLGTRGARPHEVLIRPNDILYIPPLWLHTACPNGKLSISVNVFFRNLTQGYAAGRDVYGNRDVAAYENARRDIDRLAKNFGNLPPEMAHFYLQRLADELRDKADIVGL